MVIFWTVSVFRFKKRLLAKVKKKYQKPLSKSHSWSRPCWMFQTRHTSKFCSAKKMAVSPCFVSVLLLEESFVVTYNNSRVRRVNSFQTSLFFHPRLWNLFFWSTRGSYLTYFIKIFKHYRSNFKVLSKLSDRGGRQKILQGFVFWLEIAGSRISGHNIFTSFHPHTFVRRRAGDMVENLTRLF